MGEKYSVVATAIVVKDGKYLIAKRSGTEEKFPGKWTVPGGRIGLGDHTAPNDQGVCYGVIENALRREIHEEVGLEIGRMRYLISMIYPKKEGFACCLSFFADHAGGDVRLGPELTEHSWVGVKELCNFDLIAGIPEEILMVEDIINGRPLQPWDHYVQEFRCACKNRLHRPASS